MSSTSFKFKSSFRWESTVEDFVKQHIQGYSLNMPCGESWLGDVRVDMEAKPNVTHLYAHSNDDVYAPFQPCTFDTVISDPPWKIKPFERPDWFFEMVYLTKVGGRIIYNATWIPESKVTKLEETYIRQSGYFTNASIISIFTKKTDSFDYKRKYKPPQVNG